MVKETAETFAATAVSIWHRLLSHANLCGLARSVSDGHSVNGPISTGAKRADETFSVKWAFGGELVGVDEILSASVRTFDLVARVWRLERTGCSRTRSYCCWPTDACCVDRHGRGTRNRGLILSAAWPVFGIVGQCTSDDKPNSRFSGWVVGSVLAWRWFRP